MSRPAPRLLLASLALVATSCTGERTPPQEGATGFNIPSIDRPELDSVVMVGDSITEGSAEVVQQTLAAAGFAQVVVDGDASRRIEVGTGAGGGPVSGLRTIFALMGEGADPDVWVIELGTNDVGQLATAEEYGALIDQVLALLPADAAVVWVNTYRPSSLDHTEMFNLVLAGRLQSRGNAVVADWFSVASDPEQTILQSDDLHPNDNGKLALAMLVIDAVNRL